MPSSAQAPGTPPPLRTRVTDLLGVPYPIVQAGMVWAAGAKLAAAVSEAGAFGVIGAGSMKPDLLRLHIRKARSLTASPFGVNIPLGRADASDLVAVVQEEHVRVVITSAGHPLKFTAQLKQAGCIVLHVVAAVKHARKAVEAGCDCVVAEGFEAGGHNGIDEVTTLTLVPQVADAVSVPVIAAGGIADGRGMAAALALGADAVQVGTRFAATEESSAHERYKRAVIEAGDTGTVLTLKGITPVRMLKTPFTIRVREAEQRCAGREELELLLGRKREMRGIFEGDLEEGMFEAGQSAGLVRDVLPAGAVVTQMMAEYTQAKERMP